jgi:protein involved in polysaccharide export with SLBB domain
MKVPYYSSAPAVVEPTAAPKLGGVRKKGGETMPLRTGMALPALLVIIICQFASAAIIKVGNVLDIAVQGHPEFTSRVTVAENGTVDYPLLADEVIVNLSTGELMNQLTFRLAKHIDNPLVLVSLVEKPEVAVTVLGQVMKPGPVRTYEGATLQEVLLAAGGPSPAADLSKIRIVKKGATDQTGKVYDLKAFMSTGSLDSLPRLSADDIVVVTTQERSDKIKVIGGVTKPGFFDLEEKINIFEAIYLAGGPAEKADLSRVRRLTQHDGKSSEEIINVQQYIEKGKMNEIPMVEPGDVIIVYTRFFDWQMMMTILSNALLLIVTLQTFSNIFGKP